MISPPEAKATYVRIRTQGLQIQNRTVFPIKRVKLNSSIQYFPKKVKIKFTNLPIICDDINVKKLIELPSEIQHEAALVRDQDTFGSVSCYNGKATLTVIISNSEQETTLREWSYKSRTSGGFEWNSVIVGYHIPSLHHCEHCAVAKKPSQGHHKDRCSFAAKNKSENKDASTSEQPIKEDSNNDNSASTTDNLNTDSTTDNLNNTSTFTTNETTNTVTSITSTIALDSTIIEKNTNTTPHTTTHILIIQDKSSTTFDKLQEQNSTQQIPSVSHCDDPLIPDIQSSLSIVDQFHFGFF